MLPNSARACIACVLLLPGAAAHAQPGEFTVAGELTLAGALENALRHHPDLRASAYEVPAAQARARQAALAPNPELSLELENFGGSGDVRGVDALETTLSLSQVVETGGRRALRRDAAEASVQLASTEQQLRELDVLAEVTTRFIDVVASQEQVRLADESVRLARATLAAIEARVAAARSPVAEQSRARIALTRALIDLRQEESALQSARIALAASWGSANPGFTSARASLFDLREVLPLELLLERLEQSPDLLRFVSEARLRDAELRLARAQARPGLAFSLGVRRLEDSSDTALVAGVSMPLMFRDRNEGTIREVQIRRRQSEAQAAAARIRAHASLRSLYQQLSTDRARVETLRSDALPQAQLALEQTRSGYERGRFSFLELITAQEEPLALQTAAIDAAADCHRLVAQIERLSGAALVRPAATR